MIDAEIGFAGNPLDRMSHVRGDSAALRQLAAAPGARAVAFVQSMTVVRPVAEGLTALHSLAQARGFGAARIEVLLGRDEAGPIYALQLPDEAAREEEPAEPGGFLDKRRMIMPEWPDHQLRDLRAMAHGGHLDRAEHAILAQAKSILHYHATHRFCAHCGAPSELRDAGWRRDCPACGARHFPRTDPVAIMLVVDGEKCLLGRQKHFPPGMYSALAGFVESGETLEEAVRREVLEESGIAVGRVTYEASQPWPYPASLMLGCRAEALSRDIVMDDLELEDCRWFSRAEARAMLEGNHDRGFFAPAKIAIARNLMASWVAEG